MYFACATSPATSQIVQSKKIIVVYFLNNYRDPNNLCDHKVFHHKVRCFCIVQLIMSPSQGFVPV